MLALPKTLLMERHSNYFFVHSRPCRAEGAPIVSSASAERSGCSVVAMSSRR
jgi:hypothetical protein